MEYLNPDRPIDESLFSTLRIGIEEYCAQHHRFAFDPMNPAVRLHEPTIGPAEIAAALEVLLSTKVTMGPRAKAFEKEFGGTNRHAVACNSGSSANLLAISALCDPDISLLHAGDEVIVSALSWSTTIWPLIQHGLVPVIVDIDPKTFNMDPGELERAIGRKTRAVMPVHVYGNPCDMSALKATCQDNDLLLIEDCCEALGATDSEKPVGSFGIVGTFSFYLSHHITTLEGGVAVTADTDLAERMRILRAHGWIRDVENKDPYTSAHPTIDPKFLFVGLGYNLRITELQAAIGSLQLPKLAGYVETRRDNNRYYREQLSKYGFMRFQEELPGARSSCFDFAIILTDDAPFTVAELAAYLEYQKIETRPVIAGNMARQPGMKRHKHRVIGKLPNASHVLTHGISIGNHHHVSPAAREYVVSKIDEFIESKMPPVFNAHGMANKPTAE